MDKFKNIDTWVFDLDNTLYPRHCDLFSQIDVLMTKYVSNLTGLEPTDARKLQKELYRDYGTTLRGLMETKDIDPHDFLSHVHDINYSELPANPLLEDLLLALPGRRLIYTNGSVKHAKDTLRALGIGTDVFEGYFDIISSDFAPKPDAKPFVKFLEELDVNPTSSVFFEDMPRNLEPAKGHGMMTVLITPQDGGNYSVEPWEHAETNSNYIDYATNDLDGFLRDVLKTLKA